MDTETKVEVHNLHTIIKDIGMRLHDLHEQMKDMEKMINEQIYPKLNEMGMQME